MAPQLSIDWSLCLVSHVWIPESFITFLWTGTENLQISYCWVRNCEITYTSKNKIFNLFATVYCLEPVPSDPNVKPRKFHYFPLEQEQINCRFCIIEGEVAKSLSHQRQNFYLVGSSTVHWLEPVPSDPCMNPRKFHYFPLNRNREIADFVSLREKLRNHFRIKNKKQYLMAPQL